MKPVARPPHVGGGRGWRRALELAAVAACLVAVPAFGQIPDSDKDGFYNAIEKRLGSDRRNAASTPEHVSLLGSCSDQVDNDRDGATDGQDPGCDPPEVFDTFPRSGFDIFDSTMSLDDYDFDVQGQICPLDLEARGPVVVRRRNPRSGQIPVEIVAMQLTGVAVLSPQSPCNPQGQPLEVPVTVVEEPRGRSRGQIESQQGAADFPADSFFDVFFLIDTPIGVLPGGPPGGPAGDPLRVMNVINSIPPYHSPGNPARNPNCYTVAGLPHEHCPKPPLDHFKCYTAKFPAFSPVKVFLRDQFLAADARVERPRNFCNPVDKNGEGIFDQDAHLKLYRLRSSRSGAASGTQVLVRNQFGVQELRVGRLTALAVPTQKDRHQPPRALDHFACYKVKGASVQAQVSLRDQFVAESSRVANPQLLCNPVEKLTEFDDLTPIGDRDAHLVCYRITRSSVVRNVATSNQFGTEQFTTERSSYLCAPSSKQVAHSR